MLTIIRTAVAEAAGAVTSDVHLALRPALTYQSNRLYDARVNGRHLIVKEFLKRDEFEEAPVREFKSLRLLAPLDLAPPPLLYRPHAPGKRPLVVYDFMEGEMWDRRRPSARELEQLAETWLEINRVTGDHLWPSRGFEAPLAGQLERFAAMIGGYAQWAESAFPAGLAPAARCLSLLEGRAAVIRELALADAPLCFCRADARFANVIARPDGRLGLVDWEDSGLRDPALDLADILSAPNQEDLLEWDEWQPFLKSYMAGRSGSDPGLERRMGLYLTLFPLAWLAWLLTAGVARAAAGELQGWLIHQMAPNDRLRRYLARASAWPETDFRSHLERLAEVQFFPESRWARPARSIAHSCEAS